jgi:hypothetical protein
MICPSLIGVGAENNQGILNNPRIQVDSLAVQYSWIRKRVGSRDFGGAVGVFCAGASATALIHSLAAVIFSL